MHVDSMLKILLISKSSGSLKTFYCFCLWYRLSVSSRDFVCAYHVDLARYLEIKIIWKYMY